MPIWEFSDFARITHNTHRITPKYNNNVHIEVDREFLYINGMGMPTGPAGDTGMVLTASYTGCYWAAPGGYKTGDDASFNSVEITGDRETGLDLKTSPIMYGTSYTGPVGSFPEGTVYMQYT